MPRSLDVAFVRNNKYNRYRRTGFESALEMWRFLSSQKLGCLDIFEHLEVERPVFRTYRLDRRLSRLDTPL